MLFAVENDFSTQGTSMYFLPLPRNTLSTLGRHPNLCTMKARLMGQVEKCENPTRKKINEKSQEELLGVGGRMK